VWEQTATDDPPPRGGFVRSIDPARAPVAKKMRDASFIALLASSLNRTYGFPASGSQLIGKRYGSP